MADDNDDDKPRSATDAEIEREIRRGRKLGPKDLLAHMAGPGALKGASPVSIVQQAETEVGTWLGSNLADTDGALRVVLHRHLKGSARLLAHLERPLVAVAEYLAVVLATEPLLKEIVGEADIEWGRAMDERPHFERDGVAPDPADPYTVEGVRKALLDALARLPGVNG